MLHVEDLGSLLPHCSWIQVVAAVDRLSREGRIVIRQPDRCIYTVVFQGSDER